MPRAEPFRTGSPRLWLLEPLVECAIGVQQSDQVFDDQVSVALPKSAVRVLQQLQHML
jgi:hypothetical protein